jgi:hypothetical protein
MRLQSAYFIKRLLIVALLTVLMASVGAAPDQPALFIVLSAVCIVLVRFIWKSALKDEKAINKRRLQLCKESKKMPQGLKRAA